VFPYFASGNIVISDINRGFLLVKAQSTDLIAPTAICMDATVMLDANGVATVSPLDIDNGSSDNSGTVYFIICNDTFGCGDLGANSVELEVYDDFGNKDYCTATVTVVDDLAPELNCPANASVGYDAGENFYTVPDYVSTGAVTVTDNCAAGLNVTQNPPAGTELTVGTYTIAFEATDGSGNTDSCSFELTVVEILSVNDEAFENGLSIYPNPTSELLNINSGAAGINKIVLTDMLGKRIYSNVYNEIQRVELNVSNLSNGIYFVTVNDIATKKIIKN
jgi:hypothetical protein